MLRFITDDTKSCVDAAFRGDVRGYVMRRMRALCLGTAMRVY